MRSQFEGMEMLYESEGGKLIMALVGDSMLTRGVQMFREPRFLELVELLRGADVTLANLEMLYHEFEMPWSYKEDTSFQSANPRYLADLKWMGLDMVSTAMNHAWDYGERGMLATMRHCKEAGLLHAGSGRHLDEARAPAYLDTRGGRVAMMAVTSTFTDESRAGPGRVEFHGKPGIAPLRHDVLHEAPADFIAALQQAKQKLGYTASEDSQRRHNGGRVNETEVDFLDGKFHVGSDYKLSTSCNKDDLASIANWIRSARKQSDIVVFSAHNHESGPSKVWHGRWSDQPPEFIVEFAHFCIDQGVDVFFGHGSHFLRGIEIYKGKPIFYSLGSFVLQNETIEWVPSHSYESRGMGPESRPGDWCWARSDGGKKGMSGNPAFYRSVVARCHFDGLAVKEIRLHPIDLGFGRPIAQRGRPLMADHEVSTEILRELQNVCAPYGTEVAIDGTVGVIRL